MGLYSHSYAYDLAGNRTSKDSQASTYSSDDKLLTSPAASYTYDDVGATKTRQDGSGTITYSYNYERNLTSIAYPGSGSNTFQYNAAGQRRQAFDTAGDRWFVYDGGELLAEVSPQGNATRYQSSGLFMHSDRDSGGTTRWFVPNHLTTANFSTDASGNPQGVKVWDAWGNAVTGPASSVPAGYVGGLGYYTDSQSGLQLLGLRYYDAGEGRFLSQSPLLGESRFGYTASNPVTRTDPTGLWAQRDHFGHEPQTRMAVRGTGGIPSWFENGAVEGNLWWDSGTGWARSTAWNLPPHFGNQYGFAAAQMQLAVEDAQSGNWEDSARALGGGLHAIQDAVAHEPYAGHMGHLGHLMGVDPDTIDSPVMDNLRHQTLANSEAYVDAFLSILNGQGLLIPPDPPPGSDLYPQSPWDTDFHVFNGMRLEK